MVLVSFLYYIKKARAYLHRQALTQKKKLKKRVSCSVQRIVPLS